MEEQIFTLVKENLRAMIVKIITNDLTFSRSESGRLPYTQSQIDYFIHQNIRKIEDCIIDFVKDCIKYRDIKTLVNPSLHTIGEHLSYYVSTHMDE